MKTSRRQLLRSAAVAVTAATIVPRHVLGGPKFVPPSEKVNVALVGAGGQGRTNVRAMFPEPDCQVIAVADPVERTCLEGFYYGGLSGRKHVIAEIEKHYGEKTPNFRCAEYEDFRVMLEKEKAIDAVLCATPDHVHGYVSIVSMRAGKHVYCEKPLGHNIRENRQIAKVAKDTGVATQLGNIGHSREGIRATCEWLWDGVIGPVHEVHAWVGAGRWNKQLVGVPTETPPVPQGMNWDLWLGPREPRPYHPAYAPVAWRDFWAFGSAALGDFGCHDLDAAFWALGLEQGLATVEVRPAGNMNDEIAPHGEIGYFDFAARGNKPPVKVTWYTGGLLPRCPEEMGKQPLPSRGVLFVGEKGQLLAEGAGGIPRLLPFEKTREYKKPEKTLRRVKGHHRDWLDACKGGQPASANFEYGAKLTELVLLGILSLRTRKKITWDAAAMKVPGHPEMDAIVQGQYRKGWEID